MITIDGVNYKATWLTDLEQTVEILNGDGSGRLQSTGAMHLEYIGSFVNHTGSLHRDRDCTDEEWSDLFLRLCNPKNEHTFVFPFGKNKKLTQKIYISNIKRTLKKQSNGINQWSKVYDVSFVAQEAFWLAGQGIVGVE